MHSTLTSTSRETSSSDSRAQFYEDRLSQLELAQGERSASALLLELLQTSDNVQNLLSSQLESYGLSSSAFNLLSILDAQEHHSLPLPELGHLMLASRANLSGILDALIKRGYVERVALRADRRVKLARLLPSGKRLLEQLHPPQLHIVQHICRKLDESQRAQLGALLRLLRAETHL